MAACASSSTPFTELSSSTCAEANQPNTQSLIPPSGATPLKHKHKLNKLLLMVVKSLLRYGTIYLK